MKIISSAALALGLMLGSGACAMADTIWTFNNVFFDNGNEITGSFTTNPTSLDVDSFNIKITGPDTHDAFTATQMVNAYLPSAIGIGNAGFTKYVDLYLAGPITSAGGTIDITGGYDCPDCGSLFIGSDDTPSITGVASTPEPSAVPLLGAGVVLMGIVTRRKQIRAS